MSSPTPRPRRRDNDRPVLRIVAAVAMTASLLLPAFAVPALLDLGSDDDGARPVAEAQTTRDASHPR